MPDAAITVQPKIDSTVVGVTESPHTVITVFPGGPITLGTGTGTSVALSPISGISSTVLQQALEQISLAALPKERDFTQSDLSVAGVLPFTHDLNSLHPTVEIWDSQSRRLSPDEIIIVNANAIGVNLNTYIPLSGTFHLKVSK